MLTSQQVLYWEFLGFRRGSSASEQTRKAQSVIIDLQELELAWYLRDSGRQHMNDSVVYRGVFA